MKIYVCEHGCKYEGGSSFYASIDYVDAWKACRDFRIKEFNCWSDNVEDQKYRRKKDAAYINYMHVKKNYWVSATEYICIKIYDLPDNLVAKFILEKLSE